MSAREILDYVCAARDVTRRDLRSPRKWTNLVSARRLAAGWMRAMGMSYQAIALELHRDRSSVFHLLGKPLGRPWRCSVCGENGHNRATCKLRSVAA